jgi:hypothetical protein
MNNASLMSVLASHNAAVVHFSHHAKMREGGVFPTDLQNAIEGKDDWPLSCSVVWPGHTMALCGSVGLMFEPSVNSVKSVSNNDSGSWVDPDGLDYSAGVPLTEESLLQTFDVAGAYNEWRVMGAKVTGIFVHDIDYIFAKSEFIIPAGPHGPERREIAMGQITLTDVFDAFPDSRVFTMAANGLVQVAKPARL